MTPNTLIIASGEYRWHRYPYISESELFSSPFITDEPRGAWRPNGDFNLVSYVKMLPAPWRNPDLIVVQWSVGDSIPQGLGAFKCPKVLVLGDLHHQNQPITSALKVAMGEPYDLVVVQYTQQHCHFFAEVRPTAYIPCFCVNPFNMPPTKEKQYGVTFVGNINPMLYYRRQRVLGSLQKMGVKVQLFNNLSMEDMARVHNRSVCCLNIDLNNDFNLRNFEIPAAGGCLVNYQGNTEEYAERINAFLKDPEMAYEIAVIDHTRYWVSYAPSMLIARFFDALAGKGLAKPGPVTGNLLERADMYERAQELRRREIPLTDLEDLR